MPPVPHAVPPIEAVIETAVYTTELDAAERFYADALGLTLLGRDADRHVFFRVGAASVLLIFNPQATQKGGDLPAPLGEPHGVRPLARAHVERRSRRQVGHLLDQPLVGVAAPDPLRLGVPRVPGLLRVHRRGVGVVPVVLVVVVVVRHVPPVGVEPTLSRF